MASRSINRYVWLLSILLPDRQLTFDEISQKWKESYLCDGEPLSLRTFHQHRKEIQEVFGVEIACNKQNHYRYFVKDREKLRNDRTRQWLFNSMTLSNMVTAGHNMNGRILFEEVPGGVAFVQPIIEAMQQGRVLKLYYQPFGKSLQPYHMEPYAMKVYNQRWYIVGRLVEQDTIRNIALDRIQELEITTDSFTLPPDFNAERYYANTVGIYVNEDLQPQRVRIRVYGVSVEYLRTLPLHRTQEEVLTKHEQFSEFQYRLCLTPELSSQLLAMGEKVEVLEPEELREEIKERIQTMFDFYK